MSARSQGGAGRSGGRAIEAIARPLPRAWPPSESSRPESADRGRGHEYHHRGRSPGDRSAHRGKHGRVYEGRRRLARRALAGWLTWYNRRRPHGSPGGLPPLSRVSHLRGQYILTRSSRRRCWRGSRNRSGCRSPYRLESADAGIRGRGGGAPLNLPVPHDEFREQLADLPIDEASQLAMRIAEGF